MRPGAAGAAIMQLMLVCRRLVAQALLAGLLAFSALTLTVMGPAASADSSTPAGPQLIALRATNGGPSPLYDLVFTSPGGHRRQVVYGESRGDPIIPQWGPSFTADGSMLAFAGVRSLPDDRDAPSDVYLLPADGGEAVQVTRMGDAFAPVLSPDGRWIAFTRIHGDDSFFGGTIWRIGIDGTRLRRLTRWRYAVIDLPGSFSPGGEALAYSRADCTNQGRCGYAIRTVGLRGSHGRLLARQAYTPSFSPGGERIAFASDRDRNGHLPNGEDESSPAAELYLMKADGTRPRRLTHTRSLGEVAPSWDPSGKRLAYELQVPRFRSKVMQMNADGTCRRTLLEGSAKSRYEVDFEVPSWRPGSGREASSISC